MLPRPRPLSLPPQRPSPPALLAVGALHVALLWLVSQQWPVAQAVRQVVYQYVQPVRTPTTDAAPSSRAITRPAPPALSLRATTDLPVFANTPETSVPLKTTRQLPDLSQAPVQAPGARKPAETAQDLAAQNQRCSLPEAWAPRLQRPPHQGLQMRIIVS